MPTPVPAKTSSRRVDVLDGIRGVAIVLVVLSHGWTVWPTDKITGSSLVSPWFSSGNFAVSIFFIIGSFLATSAMLRAVDSPSGLRPGIPAARRLLRLGGQMWFLLLVLLLVTALDATDTYPRVATRESVLRAGTFTWNWYVHNHPLEARPDIGHLWYLAVDLQMFLIILATVWLLRRHRAWLVATLAAMLVVLLFWRADIYSYDQFGALMRTWARGDAPVAGALAAAAVRFLRRFERHAPLVAVGSALCLLPLMYLTSSTGSYMGPGGAALDLTLALFAMACTMRPPPAALVVVLGRRPLTFLGRHSLSIYLWHYPVFWFVSRHTSSWHWETRLAVALSITAVAVYVSERLVETRVQRILDSPWWRPENGGLTTLLRDEARRLVSRSRRGPAKRRDADAPSASGPRAS